MVVGMRLRRRHPEPPASDPPAPRCRPEALGDETAEAVLERIRVTDWGQLTHAYGNARTVGPELEALTLGDEPTRRAVWSELWGTIHHQGTVYEATVPAAHVIADLAGWPAFPDRREALCMLCAFAEGDGSTSDQVADVVHDRAERLLDGWRDAPALVQRALLMLARSVGVERADLLDSVLPHRYRASWALGTSRDIWARFGDGDRPLAVDETPEFDAEMDALSELEDWAFSAE
jgi:hypothetical protein